MAKFQTRPRSADSLEHALTFVGNKIAQESVDVNSRDLLVVDAVPNAGVKSAAAGEASSVGRTNSVWSARLLFSVTEAMSVEPVRV